MIMATEDEYEAARGRYLACMEPMHAARAAHGSAWDERRLEFMRFMQEEWERRFGMIDLPPRPPCGRRSVEIRQLMVDDVKTAMAFSQNIAKAFEETGIKLEDDETFACHMCVMKKPARLSEVVRPPGTGGDPDMEVPVEYIMEPKIMQQVMDHLEQDKIKYEPDPPT
jgi:hypothetical protein